MFFGAQHVGFQTCSVISTNKVNLSKVILYCVTQ